MQYDIIVVKLTNRVFGMQMVNENLLVIKTVNYTIYL